MRTLFALIIGCILGLLIYFESAMVFLDHKSSEGPSGLFILITFIGGWVLTTYLVRKGAKSISKVFCRGFLIGALLWFMMIPIGVIFSGKAVVSYESQSSAEQTGAMLGGGIFAFLSGGVSIVMAIICLLGFALFYFLGKEMKAEPVEITKLCPQCAEKIQNQAIVCRFCGYKYEKEQTIDD